MAGKRDHLPSKKQAGSRQRPRAPSPGLSPRAAPERSARGLELRTAVKFVAFGGLLFAVYFFPYASGWRMATWLRDYLGAYARLAGAFVWLFDRAVMVKGDLITGRFSIRIVRGCESMEVNLLFVAAIAAIPAPWPRKLVALGAGVIVLTAANVARIGSLYLSNLYAPSWVDVLHFEMWPLVLMAVLSTQVVGWAFWMQGARRSVARAATTGADR